MPKIIIDSKNIRALSDDEVQHFRLLAAWDDLAQNGIQHATISEAEAIADLISKGDTLGYQAKIEELLALEPKRRDYLKPKMVHAIPKVHLEVGQIVALFKGDDGQLYAEPATPGQGMHGLYIADDTVITSGVIDVPTPPDAPDYYL